MYGGTVTILCIVNKRGMDKKMKTAKKKRIINIWLTCLMVIVSVVSSWGMNNRTTITATAASTAETLSPDIDTVMNSVRAYMLKKDTNPDYVNSTWNVIGLSRSGLTVPQDYYDTYYKNTVAYLEENNWAITKAKYSEYSKLILAMTAIGKDVTNIEGHNLFSYLSDFKNVKKQGFNGPIWALIALKCHPDYTIPEDSSASEQTTEEKLIDYLVSREVEGGGWTLYGTVADSDITGMTIQALASYYGKRDDVTEAIDRAINWLSESQLESGGYATIGTETSESVSQIIVALSAVGVDGAKDQRFIKNGKWPMTGLFQYYLAEGGFMHVAANAENNGGGAAGTLDGLATEQGFYATVAYKRMLDGKTALYDMSDIQLNAGNNEQNPSDQNTSKEETTVSTTAQENTTSAGVKVIGLTLDYSEITLNVGKTKTLTATVTPSNAADQTLKWSSSNKKVATVSKKGKITGKKAGTTKITVKTTDGSGLKVVCKVTVSETGKSTTTNSTSNRSQTKKVNLVSAAKSTVSDTTNKKDSKTNTSQEGNQREETTGGWSFEGEDYIPETASDMEAVDENVNVTEDTVGGISGAEPMDYIMMGVGGTLLTEAILWALWKLGKKGTIRYRTKKNEKKEGEEQLL